MKRDTEALRNAQVQETGRAEERHTEAMEGQKQLKIAAYRAALEEYTRDRVPLDWARSTGSQGVALMLIAERLDDATRARTAVQQIEVAFVTMRDGRDAPVATYYEAQLPKARALFDRLASRH